MKRHGQAGFSLVEMLVTVGIFAVVTSIAVPSYRRYSRHSKTAEAQSSLGQVYMAEKSFFLQWRFYTGDLVVAGVAPEGEMLYNVGFSATAAPPTSYKGTSINTAGNRDTFFEICGKQFGSGTLENCAFKNSRNKNGFNAAGITANVTISGTATATTATNTGFTAMAIADLIHQAPPKTDPAQTTHDIWSIDNFKQIVRVQDGTKKQSSTTSGTTGSTTGSSTSSTTGSTTGSSTGSTTGGTTGSSTGGTTGGTTGGIGSTGGGTTGSVN